MGYTFATGGSSLPLDGGGSEKVDESQDCEGAEFEVSVDNLRGAKHGRLVTAAIVDDRRRASMSMAKKCFQTPVGGTEVTGRWWSLQNVDGHSQWR